MKNEHDTTQKTSSICNAITFAGDCILGCFWLETRVKLESGRIVQMSELKVGDRVLSNIRNGIEEFSNVCIIAHIGKLDHEEKFTKISFTKPNGYKGIIPNYLFVE